MLKPFASADDTYTLDHNWFVPYPGHDHLTLLFINAEEHTGIHPGNFPYLSINTD